MPDMGWGGSEHVHCKQKFHQGSCPAKIKKGENVTSIRGIIAILKEQKQPSKFCF